MAKRLAIPSDELKVKVVGPFDSIDVPRVQRVTMNTDVPSTDIYELGNNKMAGTTIDIPAITLSLSLFDTGIKAFAVLTGKDPAAYPGAGVDISDLQEVDAILYIKNATAASFAKTAHAKRLQVQDFSFNYTVDGESTEDYTLVGSEKRWFKNDVVVDRFTTGTTSFTLTETPTQLVNGNYGLSVILDGEYLQEVTGAPATGEYRIVGTTLTTGDTRTAQVIAVYYSTTATGAWTYIADTQMPAAIRGKDVKVKILAETLERVTGVTINGNLNVQSVKEMGNDFIVGYQRQVPTIDGTLTVLDTDTELIDLLLNGSINSGATEFQLGTECVASGVALRVQLLDPCDTSNTTVLKTVYIPKLVLTGDSYTANINQNAQQVFNWKSDTAECLVFSGAY